MRISFKPLLLSALAVGIVACSDSDNVAAPAPAPATPPAPTVQEFEVSVVNLTAAQPLSPIAVVAHREGYSAFTIGSPATAGLELLAEGGDNSTFLSEASNNDAVQVTTSTSAPTGPGATSTASFNVAQSDLSGLMVSAVTMLVNTNDAITAVRNVSLEGMAVGDSRRFNTIGYDSGTEANSEAAGTIPGPADGGEGLNAARDDIADKVTAHTGVITASDGLSSSVLTEVHRWDNPVARITVTRVQ